jgi:hypothetical protein
VIAARHRESLTSLQQRLVKTGGRLVKHARYDWLLLAEAHWAERLFGTMLGRISGAYAWRVVGFSPRYGQVVRFGDIFRIPRSLSHRNGGYGGESPAQNCRSKESEGTDE